jgi:molybdopterin-containing oxidoreductase family membrane subunit
MSTVFAKAPRASPALRPLVETTWRIRLLFVVLLAVIAWAAYAYSVQLSMGLGTTGMNAPAYWGIYIVNFVYLIGLSAGGVIVASLAYVFNLKEYKPVARIAELLAIMCLVLAVVFVTLDIGRPERLANLLLFGNVWSPLFWDFIVIAIYMLICLVYGYLGTRPDIVAAMKAIPRRARLYRLLALGYTDVSPEALRRDERTLRAIALAALPTAIALHSVTAWILGLMKAQPGWHSALLAPLFVVSAIVSGLALVIVATLLAKRFLGVQVEEGVIRRLGRFLVWLIPIDFYFAFAELITIQYGRMPAEFTTLQDITLGPLAWAFWAEMIVGLLLPFLLIARPDSRTPRRIGIAAFLVFIGVFFKRIDIVLPSLIFRWLPFPAGGYAPTWVELSLMAGVYAFGVLLVTVFAKLFPLVPLVSEETAEVTAHADVEPAPA